MSILALGLKDNTGKVFWHQKALCKVAHRIRDLQRGQKKVWKKRWSICSGKVGSSILQHLHQKGMKPHFAASHTFTGMACTHLSFIIYLDVAAAKRPLWSSPACFPRSSNCCRKLATIFPPACAVTNDGTSSSAASEKRKRMKRCTPFSRNAGVCLEKCTRFN